MTRIAVTVIGTNLVMDYGSNEAAVAAMDAAMEWSVTRPHPQDEQDPQVVLFMGGMREWQRDLLTFDADGRTLPQVVADLLGVKSIDLRTERGDDGEPTSEDRRWRVQYFGGTYGGTLDEAQGAPAPDALREAAEGLLDVVVEMADGQPYFAQRVRVRRAARDLRTALAQARRGDRP